MDPSVLPKLPDHVLLRNKLILCLRAISGGHLSTAMGQKKQFIHFTDAIGRTFKFPLGVEHLIKQAFRQNDAYGTEVMEGRYTLLDPDGDIILPSAWKANIESGMHITMTLWPNETAPAPRALPEPQEPHELHESPEPVREQTTPNGSEDPWRDVEEEKEEEEEDWEDLPPPRYEGFVEGGQYAR
ncbi:hypothetical protein NW762_010523 [Fusarium torreyae]|uniref:Ubiquitin-like domain-containing protein n=1 Tax=Fusarium torreyae TaxID=1237075 RepID=A0A9W8RRE6_9HYPO|nr:hypothetical protein NW762_010523 [Fusarium torreyae]